MGEIHVNEGKSRMNSHENMVNDKICLGLKNARKKDVTLHLLND